MNRKKIIIIASVFVVLMVLVSFVFMQINGLGVTKKGGSELLPTRQIGKGQSVGGAIEAAADQMPNRVKDNKSSVQADTVDASSRVSARQLTDAERAPKQQEIKKIVGTEYLYKALGTSNDPLTTSSWALSNTKAKQAWDISTGNSVVVAVIDSGFALVHEDLANQWQVNQLEQGQTQAGDRCWTGSAQNKQTNACDDDNNGYVDDYKGWSFVDSTNTPQAGKTNPVGVGVAHGTEVAGLVGATGNNGVGIATFGWNTRVMPLQALDDDGSGYTSDVIAAIYYAVDNGAKVINMSLGSASLDPSMVSAINYAYSHNVIVVAAAGNCGTGTEAGCTPSLPGQMSYPALYDHVISVGATTQTNARANFSSYGPLLDVVAPGSGSMVSPMWRSSNTTNAYASSLFGTSFASPMVAGYVALLKGVRPGSSVEDITALVDGTAQKVSAMSGAIYTSEYGHGLIDAQAILQVASGLNATATSSLELKQTGGYKSEHSYSSGESLGSGCNVAPTTYCTVVFVNQTAKTERYLPYRLADSSGNVGWSWAGTTLDGSGLWQVSAQQGQSKAGSYMLSSK